MRSMIVYMANGVPIAEGIPVSQKYDPEEIRQRMNALRSSLDNHVEQVATGVRAKSDWRYYVRNYPWLAVGAATAAGYVLMPRRVQNVVRTVADPDVVARMIKKEHLVTAPESSVKAGVGSGLMSKLTALALAAGSRAAVGYLSNQLGTIMDQPKKEAETAAMYVEETSTHTATKPK